MLVTSILGLVVGGIVIYVIYNILTQPDEKLHTEPNPAPEPVKEEPVVVVEPTPEPAAVVIETAPVVVEVAPEQTRNALGQFVADDPATPDVNEAWVGGEAPKPKTAKKPKAKKAADTTTAPKKKTQRKPKVKVVK